MRVNVAPDWTGTPAPFFRVTMSDEASRNDRLWDAAELVRAKVIDELRLEDLDLNSYGLRTKTGLFIVGHSI